MNPEEIVQKVLPPYQWFEEKETTWEAEFQAIRDDPIEYGIIARLRQDLRENGGFRQPIWIMDGRLQNGRHRLLAALEEQMPIEVTDQGMDAETVDLDIIVTQRYSDDEWDDLFALLRSFPIGTEWTESDGMSVCQRNGKTELCVSFYWPKTKLDELSEVLKERIQGIESISAR